MIPICIVTKGLVNDQKTFANLPDKYKECVWFFSNDSSLEKFGRVVDTGNMSLNEKRQAVIGWAKDKGFPYVVMTDDDTRFLRLLENGKAREAFEENFDSFFERAIDILENEEDWGLLGTHGYAFSNTSKEVSYGLHNFYIINVNAVEGCRYDRVSQFEDIDFILQVMSKGLKVGKLNLLISDNAITYVKDNIPSRDEIIVGWAQEYPFVSITQGDGALAGKSISYKVRIQWSWPAKNKPTHVTLEI